MTNEVQIAILTLVLTNWVTIEGTLRRDEGETNYFVKQWAQSVETNVVQETVTPIVTYQTNRTVVRSTRQVFDRTNAVVAWNPHPIPPLPGAKTKE